MAFKEIQDRVNHIAKSVGRKSSDIQILPVSKGQSIEKIMACLESPGFPQRLGENYFNHMRDKQKELSEEFSIEWHYLGALQSRKLKDIFTFADVVHSVSRIKELELLSTLGLKEEARFFLQFNVSDESSKGGFSPVDVNQVREVLEEKKLLSHFAGLMTLASPLEEAGERRVREEFALLRSLRDKCFPGGLLSMGMSSDFECAVAEGANVLRVGSAIFGNRK